MQRQSSQRGFSIIELIVVITVLGVLAAAALPSMADFFDKKRLISQTEAIANLLQFARSESVKHPSSDTTKVVSATVSPSGSWFVGLSNGTTACTSTTCKVYEAGTQVTRIVTATECTGCTITAPTATTVITFDLRGLVSTGSATITLQSPRGKRLAASISTIGRITLCSPNGTVPGYPTSCP